MHRDMKGVRTKRRLAEALGDLLETRPLERAELAARLEQMENAAPAK